MSKYVLDACALIALLQDEDGADIVDEIINSASEDDVEVIMHKANLLEVYYNVYKARGKADADLMLFEFGKLPVKINAEISDDIFNEAGRLKAKYKISFADSLALAQAFVYGGKLITSDHHEFDAIESIEPISFHWIR
jgi:predicted nucleic acid-binding protein